MVGPTVDGREPGMARGRLEPIDRRLANDRESGAKATAATHRRRASSPPRRRAGSVEGQDRPFTGWSVMSTTMATIGLFVHLKRIFRTNRLRLPPPIGC